MGSQVCRPSYARHKRTFNEAEALEVSARSNRRGRLRLQWRLVQSEEPS